MNGEKKTKLVKSLEKGNLAPVTFARKGGEDKMFISATRNTKLLPLRLQDAKSSSRASKRKKNLQTTSRRKRKSRRNRMLMKRMMGKKQQKNSK